MSKDDYARAVIAEGRRRGITTRGIVIALATVLVESNLVMYANAKVPESLALPHEAVGSDGFSVGLFQQQVRRGTNGQWWWGDAKTCMDPTRSAGLFYDRLSRLDYNNPANSPGSYAQAVQRSAFPDRYDQRMGDAQAIYDRLASTVPQQNQETAMGWTGDPTWLADVLGTALGDRLVVEPGWENRGTGNGVNGTNQMGNIWGVMIHHTGNDRETVAGIRDGREELAGPLSQCLITPDGRCHLIAIGPCNHAGIGSYPGVPTNQGNQHLIGFECAWPTIRPDGTYDPAQRWPDAQVITMRDASAAVLNRIATDSGHVIGHKEYAGSAQGKWDPGNMDMNWFRGEVAKAMRGDFSTKPPIVVPDQPPSKPPALPAPTNPRTDRQLTEEIWDQLRGPGGNGWRQLGGRTLVDAVAVIGQHLGIEGFQAPEVK